MITQFCCTRFNTETWRENMEWRRKNNWNGCIYGTPIRINEDYCPLDSPVIILEMNNDVNKIMGIGLIRNKISIEYKYKIYSWGNYNRFVYKSKYRINREECNEEEIKLIRVLDILLFKGPWHCKRGQGISKVPDWIFEVDTIQIKEKLKKMFIKRGGT